MLSKKKKRIIIFSAVFVLLILYFLKNSSMFVRVAGFFTGILIFYFIDTFFKIDFKPRHYFYISIILSFGILLSPLYFVSDNYDKILHFVSPIFGSTLIFYMIDDERFSFQWKILVTFMFLLSFLAIHEMGEYIIDLIWDMKLQGVYVRDVSGLEKFHLVLPKNDDTMIDLLLGTAGALVFAAGKIVGYLWKKRD